MNKYFFKQALLPNGWAKNVRIEIDDNGNFSSVTTQSNAENNDSILDCVIPAMPNCHSHVFQRTMAGLTEFKTANSDSFWSWRDLMYQYANKIDASQLYHIAKYCYSEMLQAGYASVCEFHYIHQDLDDKNNCENMSMAIVKAAHEVGIRLTLLPVLYQTSHIDGSQLNDLQSRFYLSTEQYISLYNTLNNKLYPEQNIGLCFHSLRAVNVSQIKRVISELGSQLPIHIHISEQMAEVNQIQQYSNMRPVELLFHHFDVNENWNLVHATHLNAHEIQMIADSNAIAVLCPMTEANLGDGVFPLSQFMQHKGRFSIGSDSHILINPFQEIQVLEYSQRLIQQQRIIGSDIKSPHVGTYLWNQSVKNGALSAQQNLDGIQTGQLAQWLSIDTDHAMLTSLSADQILNNLIFANNKICTHSYTKGKKLPDIDKNIVQNYKNSLKSLR